MFNYRIIKGLVLMGLFLCGLVGCGQSGPLYLPQDCPPGEEIQPDNCDSCPKF